MPTASRARLFVLAIAALLCAAGLLAAPQRPAPAAAVPTYGFRVVNSFPHDPNAYTQGLLYRDGYLYESTGLHGRSSLRRVKLETGEVVQRRDVDPAHFAEGLVDWQDQLIQLTWRSQVAFVYDRATLAPRRTFQYRGEGWGLTRDARDLIMSDGTDVLRFLDPATFAERRLVTVKAAGVPVTQLNELELVRGEVWANVYQTDRIARIEPATGRVTGWIDLSGLIAGSGYRLSFEAVLNGIAYDPAGDRLFVTGKLWPRLFEIRIVPARSR